MNIKVIYNGEMGFRQTLQDVYEYLIPTKHITYENFIKYSQDTKSKTNAELVYDKMLNMDFFNLYEEAGLNLFCDMTDTGYVLKPFKSIKQYIEDGNQIVCPSPCVFYIDSEDVSEGIILQSSNLIQTEPDSNYNKDNDEIIHNLILKNKARSQNQNVNIVGTNYTRQRLRPLVWVWCKSLCPNGKFMPNSIFNLSPFVGGISTTETETGGNFTLNLLSVEGELNDSGDLKSVWSPAKNSFINVDDNLLFRKIRSKMREADKYPDGDLYNYRDDPYNRDFNNQGINSDITSENLILDGTGSDSGFVRVKVNNLFENLLSPNDVVFISYYDQTEPDMEYTEGFFTDNKQLPHLQWDMIGLINGVSVTTETEGASQEESVNGMDLMKLLIEDGTYFFMNSSGSDTPSSVFENIQIEQQGDQGNVGLIGDEGNRKSSNRTPMGLISSLYIPTQRNIGFVMNLLFSKLCNVEICPTKLFEYYENKTVYNIPILEDTDKK